MLTETETRKISDEMSHYELKKAVCIEALRIVQESRGWISDEAIADIATYLEMKPAEVDGVATFYNLIFRHPVGKSVVFVCDSVSCWIMGCDRLINELTLQLGIKMGQTTPDGVITVLPIACLGVCEQAPAIRIHNQTITRVSPVSLMQMIQMIQSLNPSSLAGGNPR